MTTGEERRKILEMVAGGTMSADEAAKLLHTDEGAEAPEPPAPPPPPDAEAIKVEVQAEAVASPAGSENGGKAAGKKAPSWLHVRVSDLETGKDKVKVNIPLRVVKFGMRLGRSFAPEMGGLDWEELDQLLAQGGSGLLVDVQDVEDGEHVQVYVD